MKKELLVVIALLLVLVNGLLLKQNCNLRKMIATNPGVSYQEDKQTAPNFILYDNAGKEYNSRSLYNDHRFKLFFLFSLANCALCDVHRETLSQLALNKNLYILGIVNHEDSAELSLWVENEKLPFPILFDKKGTVTEAFNMPESPIFILTNETGLMIYVSKATEDGLRFISKTYLGE